MGNFTLVQGQVPQFTRILWQGFLLLLIIYTLYSNFRLFFFAEEQN